MLLKTSRRRLLGGITLGAGAALLWPLVGRLVREARAQTPTHKNLIIYTTHLGIVDAVRPTPGATEADFDLGGFDPLEAHRSDMLLLAPFFNPFDHHLHGSFWPLTVRVGAGGSPSGNKLGRPGGISFDRFMGNELGASDPFSSLSFSAHHNVKKAATISADGFDAPYPPHTDAAQAFMDIFGGLGGGNADEAAARLAQDRKILDFIAEDIARVRPRLAGLERQKLDQYLDSLDRIHTKIDGLDDSLQNCDSPGPGPTEDAVKLEAFTDMAVQSLMCGLTHVVLLDAHTAYSGEQPNPEIEIGSHRQWHEGGKETDLHLLFHRYHAANIARIRERLAEIPSGDGTLADDTMILVTNTSGGSHHNGSYDIPAMIVGAAGTGLRTGRYVELPQSTMEENDSRDFLPPAGTYDSDYENRAPKAGKDAPVHCISDLLVSVANSLGVGIETFGDPEMCKGPVPGLV